MEGVRGESNGVVHKDSEGKVDMFAHCWVDKDRRYFILNVDSLADGNSSTQYCWHQVDGPENAPPEFVKLMIAQPKATEWYYKAVANIDHHNRHRYETLTLETKLLCKKWYQ